MSYILKVCNKKDEVLSVSIHSDFPHALLPYIDYSRFVVIIDSHFKDCNHGN